MKTHKDLHVWQDSINFVTSIYKITRTYPKDELYGITSQMRRSAISVPANIAEGASRSHNNEFKQFLYIALSSAVELETHIIISNNLGYLPSGTKNDLDQNLDSISKRLQGLIKSLDK